MAPPEDIGVLTADIVFATPRIRNTVVYLAGAAMVGINAALIRVSMPP
ncbi:MULTISPECIES: hypothetical protein [Mycolicibacterium]|nr:MULTISPECIES: hypothetical protein [Mycolicibacterium]MCW1823691.1 hypothetical protein [Mycolicibacterium senegalense]